MAKRQLHDKSAGKAAAGIRSGTFTSEDVVRSCLDRIAGREEAVQAWAHLQPDLALGQARGADRKRAAGHETGPLHGVPVGVKDIIDTRDLPTECGCPALAGRRPELDASVVTRMREAGLVIMGKTVTTEFANRNPNKTRNPHDPNRTPGGSSSGSAAAVGDGMVPLAIGSQTSGSVLRPASYCGVYGYKPTFGAISRCGMSYLSRRLDHVGLFARRLKDLALLGDILFGPDGADPDTMTAPEPTLAQQFDGAPKRSLRLAFVRTPVWEEGDAEMRQLMEAFATRLGGICRERDLPPDFDGALVCQDTIMKSAMAHHLRDHYEAGNLSPVLTDIVKIGASKLASDYVAALELQLSLGRQLDDLLADYDAILTPAAPGVAPLGLESTGRPIFNAIWTLCGNPALSLPFLENADGLPIGVQLVGRRGEDANLMRTARTLQALAEDWD